MDIMQGTENLNFATGLLQPPYCLAPIITIEGTYRKERKAMICPTTIFQNHVDGFIDTGASASFINAAYLHTLLTNSQLPSLQWTNLPQPIDVQMGNGVIATATQQVSLPIHILGETFQTRLIMLTKLAHNLILGIDFLRNHQAAINFGQNILSLVPDEGLLTISLQNTLYEVEIPASSECIVSVNSPAVRNQTVFVRSHPPLAQRHGVYTAKGVTQINEFTCLVGLCNLNLHPVELPKGTIVACTEEVDANEYYEILDVNGTKTETYKVPEGLNLSENTLLPHEQEQLESLVKDFADCFAPNPKRPEPVTNLEHRINTDQALPINSAPYRASPAHRKIIEQQITEMEDNQIIKPSQSPWAAPIVLVDKKDGSPRFCVDYRKLNAVTKKDKYPLPRIDDCLGGNKYFSTFDLASGYWQIPVNEADQEKTAFISHTGLYEFNVMPFGLVNAPATFQRFMDRCLAGLKWRSLLVYLDDIIVFSKDVQTHLQDLQEVFIRLRANGLHLKASKCFLFKPEIEYLGHVVSTDGIRPNPAKIRAIIEMELKSCEDVHSFLGMASYYRKYIKNYAAKAAPLTILTKEGSIFKWGIDEQSSEKAIKTALTEAPILGHPDFSIPFILQTDACDKGLGLALCQRKNGKEIVIEYNSRTLAPAEKAWAPREKEALGIIWGCETCRPYIIGAHFTVETDHESLQWLLKAKKPARLVRWALRLSEFDFDIVYRRGTARQTTRQTTGANNRMVGGRRSEVYIS